MKTLLLMLAAITAYGQTEVRISQKSPDTGYQMILGYSGTNVIYICKAASIQKTSPSIAIASATNANPVVFTVSGGHGFDSATSPAAKPSITVSGGTGQWVVANATWTATILSSTTFSVPLNSTAIGAMTGTIVFTTRAPRTTDPVWSVQAFTYDGSNNLTGGAWAIGTPSFTQTCTGSPSQYQ